MNRLRPNMAAPSQASLEQLAGRQRVNLTPGHSLMDWIRLGREKGDLSGVGSKKRDVTLQELGQHNTENDIWMAIKGKVYNITPYMEFHPGGISELMRAAGADGTQLFEEIHSWVNVESMLSKCLVGPLVLDDPNAPHRSILFTKKKMSIAAPTFLPPPVLPDEQPSPTYDWYQSEEEVKLDIYTKHNKVPNNYVVVDISSNEVIVEVYVKEYTYFVHFKPLEKVEDTCNVTTHQKDANTHVKVEIALRKKTPMQWSSLGTTLKLDKTFIRTKFAENRFWHWMVVSNSFVTHDTRLIGLKSPPGTRMLVPLGYHFIIHHKVEGMELARSYTVVLPSLKEQDITSQNDKMIYLMIKRYQGGALSPWITSIKPGEKVKINRFDGTFEMESLEDITHLIMLAAGTGFTSMIRPIYHILYDRPSNAQTIKMKLLFYNKAEKDILWREQLDELANHYDNFTAIYCLSNEVPDGWTSYTGRVSSEHIRSHVPKPSDKVKPLVLVCGQFAFNDTVNCMLRAQGLKAEHIHTFSSTT